MPSVLVLLRLFSLFWLGTLVLSVTVQAQASDLKEVTCCKKTSRAHIKTEITKCIIHPKTDKCEAAVIFCSDGKMFCSDPRVRWVKIKKAGLEKNGTPCLDWQKNINVQ